MMGPHGQELGTPPLLDERELAWILVDIEGDLIMRQKTRGILAAAVMVALAAQESKVRADLIPINTSAFAAGTTLIDFEGVPIGTNPNGLSLGGATFTLTSGGSPYNLATIDSLGPGNTNSVNGRFIDATPAPVSLVLTVGLPSASTQFGYGYAILARGTVPAATTTELFDGSVSLGSLSYTASPDPFFPGGFAGIRSTTPFTSARVTFSPTASAWVLDNVRITAVPEPSSLTLTCLGAVGVLVIVFARRRRLARVQGG
jgi:PEP-CTERM motif-containing protein